MSLAVKQHLVSKSASRKTGAAVTFTLENPGTYDRATNTYSGGSSSTVTGYASRVPGDPERYKLLGLTEGESPTLLFTPDTNGDRPELLSTVSWASTTYTVRDVEPWAPDGTARSCRVVVSRG